MTVIERGTLEVLVGLVILPAAAGPLLARWACNRAKRSGLSPAFVRGLRGLCTVAWVSLVLAGLLVILGPPPFLSTLTITGIAGVTVSLALQTTLQNLVAGLMLHSRRFLRPGDVVQFNSISGTVVGLGPVSTVIRLEDGTLAFVSNANLLGGPLINRTASTRLSGEY
jgi:small conductance mechanosensitive channel